MKQSKLILKTGLAIFLAGNVASVMADNAVGNASAEIIPVLTVAESAGMNFGQIAASAAAGTVDIAEDGTLLVGGGVLATAAGTAGEFTVTGLPGAAIIVSMFDANALLADVAAVGANMPLTVVGPATPPTNIGALGTVAFNVKAQLVVNANQTPGTYNTATSADTYTVTVNYQ